MKSGHSPLLAAGGADDVISIDQNGFGVPPSLEFAAEGFDHIDFPHFGTVLDVEAGEDAGGGQGVEVVAIDGGGGAGAVAPIVFVDGPEGSGPQFFTGGGI